MLEKLRRLFSPADSRQSARRVDVLDRSFISDASPFVVGGCGRSGTTLVRVILNAHPEICCGPESDLFRPQPLHLPRLAQRFDLDLDRLELLAASSSCRAEFVDRFAEICCLQSGKSRWAEKTPDNVFSLEWIFGCFPKAKFIHVLRDGRDVACSLRNHPRYRLENGRRVPLNTNRPIPKCAARWRESLVAAKPFAAEPGFYTVKYESLIASPRETIASLLEFLGVPWHDNVLRHSEVDTVFRDPAAFPQNPEAIMPITKDASGRWKRDLSAEEKLRFKEVAGDLLVEWGYAENHDW